MQKGGMTREPLGEGIWPLHEVAKASISEALGLTNTNFPI